jgi:ABC-type branched-subunit amino acid transport system permease subunit
MANRVVRAGTRPASIRETVQKIAQTKVAGRSLEWYLTGWRIGVFFLVLAVLFPQFVGNNGALTYYAFTQSNEALVLTGASIGIYVILALGLNIVVGYAGLLDLGYVAFYALGAYFVAVWTNGFLNGTDGQPHTLPIFSWWLLFPIAAVVASFFGILLGAPTLRLRGDYLAIVTLGFGEIVPIFFNNVPWFLQENGMSALGPNDIGPLSFTNPTDHIWIYYLTLAVLVLVIFAVRSLRNSSLGRAWVAIREDETAAAASGVNLVRTKLLAFALGALVGGVGGALFAGLEQNVDTSTMNFNFSITILIMIVLGGIGSIPGVIVGAIILRFLDAYGLGLLDNFVHGSSLVASSNAPLHFLAGFDFNTAKYLIFGLILLTMILLRPQGLIPDVRRQRELKGIGASSEGASAVGLLEREEVGTLEAVPEGEDTTVFTGAGSDALGREG